MMNSRFLIVYDESGDLPTDETTLQNDEINEILQEINSNLQEIREELHTDETLTDEVTTEEVTTEEVTTEELTESGIIYLGSGADTHDYLSTQVENATINDLYTIGLSIRNIILLFGLFYFLYRAFGALKNVIYRIMDR